MKWLMVLVSALVLVAILLFPPSIIVACPLGLLTTLAFVVMTRHEREDRERRKHRELLDAARRR